MNTVDRFDDNRKENSKNYETKFSSTNPMGLIYILTNPVSYFSNLRVNRKIGINTLIILFLYGIISFFLSKYFMRSTNVIPLLSPELRNENTFQILYIGTTILSIFQFIFSMIISTLLYKLFLFFTNIRLTFKGLLHIVIMAQVPILIGKVINLLFINQETSNIPITSLGFTTQKFIDSVFLSSIFSSLEIFNIWSVILIGLGVGVCVGVPRKKSISIILLSWLGMTSISAILVSILN